MRNTSPLEQKKTAKKDDKEGKKDVKLRLLTYTVSQKKWDSHNLDDNDEYHVQL